MITERIDSITKIKDFRALLPAPKSVKVELSGRCNYRCGFCALRTRENQPKNDMSLEFFQRISRQMRNAGVEELGLFYLGESFMNPALLENALKFAKQIGFPYVFLTSNASLAHPFLVSELMKSGLDSLKWSVNASDSEQFSEVMGVKPKLYEQALENIKLAFETRQAYGFKTKLYASSIRYDGEQQQRMEKLLKERVLPYVDQHYWLPLYSMGAFATQREAELGFKPIAGNQGRLEALREPLPCWSAFTEGHITADGKLSACCFDANSNWIMADLNVVSFMEGWNSREFVSLREAHLKKDVRGTVCENCIAYAH